MRKSKRVLSIVTAAALTASAFSGLAFSASADEILDAAAVDMFDAVEDVEAIEDAAPAVVQEADETETAELAENTVYIDEPFTYDDHTVISSVGSDVESAPDPVTLGSIVYQAGRRANGPINDYAKIEGGVLKINGTNYSTSGRGIIFTFEDGAIPAVADIADGQVLEMSFDVKTSGAFEVTGYGSLTTDDLTTGQVNVRIILDKSASQQYLIVTNADGAVIKSKAAALAAQTFTGMSFRLGTAWVEMDNLKVEAKDKDCGTVTFNVKDSAGAAVADAAVKVTDTYSVTTGADGSVTVALPNGSYDTEVSKSGYEHTKGLMDNDKASVTVDADDQSVDFTMSLMAYDKIPETVTINDGQAFIAAPKSAEPNTTEAFTVSVLDQYGIAMESDEYTLTWAVYPAGSETADPNVTIDGNGVVSVAQGFSADGDIAAYDIKATAVANNEGLRGMTVSKALYVGKNDIIYYEPIAWSVSAGSRSNSASLSSVVTLADISSITLDLTMQEPEGQRTLFLMNGSSRIAGLQYQKATGNIVVGTGWSGNAAYNQSGDVDKFVNQETLITGYSSNTPFTVTLVIDKTTNTITASSGSSTVSVPIDGTAPASFTGFATGLYRNYGAMTMSAVMVKEPDNNYLSITGDTDFAKISGQTITREYALGQSVLVPDETFVWKLFKDGEELPAPVEGYGIAEVSEASYAAVLTPTESGKAVVIKALYDENGALLSVVSADEIEVTAGTPVTIEASAGEKVMLWNSVSGQKPMAEAAEAAEATEEPTEEPTAEPTEEPTAEPTEEPTAEPTEEPTAEPTEEPTAEPTEEPASDYPIYVDQNGVLYVTDQAVPGEYVITATSALNAEKTASLTVTIGDFQTFTNDDVEVVGAKAYDIKADTAGKYSITKAVDSFGDDVTALIPAAVWSSDNEDVIAVTEDGAASIKGAGTAAVTAVITNGTAVSEITVPVTVGDYFITVDASGDATDIDTSSLVSDPSVTGYMITTSNGGKLVKQEIVDSAPSSVDTTGADKAEVAPVFEVSNITSSASAEVAVPAGTYNFEISGASGTHFDPYVNGQMLANNMLQGGMAVNSIKVNDIAVNEGYANINLRDAASNSKAGKVTMVKSPSIVDRTKKVYVLGDSLVCIYANGGSASQNYQTGWGQVLQSYLTDEYEVVDLGNSGVTAEGLAGSAITQVAISGQSGDVMILESGYNDRSYSTQAKMLEAVKYMYDAASANGVDVVLTPPNASQHDYKSSVSWGGVMKTAADETGAKYIDLGALSYSFLYGVYGDNTDAVKASYNVSDGLHANFNGANKFASIVAGGLIDVGLGEMVNTEYVYTFTDSLGNTITCQAAATAE